MPSSGKFGHLIDRRVVRIRFGRSTRFGNGHAGVFQDVDDLVIEAASFNRAAAIDERTFYPKPPLLLRGELIDLYQNKFCSVLKYEIVHDKTPFLS